MLIKLSRLLICVIVSGFCIVGARTIPNRDQELFLEDKDVEKLPHNDQLSSRIRTIRGGTGSRRDRLSTQVTASVAKHHDTMEKDIRITSIDHRVSDFDLNAVNPSKSPKILKSNVAKAGYQERYRHETLAGKYEHYNDRQNFPEEPTVKSASEFDAQKLKASSEQSDNKRLDRKRHADSFASNKDMKESATNNDQPTLMRQFKFETSRKHAYGNEHSLLHEATDFPNSRGVALPGSLSSNGEAVGKSENLASVIGLEGVGMPIETPPIRVSKSERGEEYNDLIDVHGSITTSVSDTETDEETSDEETDDDFERGYEEDEENGTNSDSSDDEL